MPGTLLDALSVSSDQSGRKVAQYKVFWNKPQQKRVLVLQFPNRQKEEALNNATGNKPLEVRIKPNSGLVEVDIPIPVDTCYDRSKGLQFGQALKQSKTLQNQGEYGLSGGFGAQTHPQARTARAGNVQSDPGPSEDEQYEDFEDCVRQGQALGKLTLGGRMNALRAGDPIYAIGAFVGGS